MSSSKISRAVWRLLSSARLYERRREIFRKITLDGEGEVDLKEEEPKIIAESAVPLPRVTRQLFIKVGAATSRTALATLKKMRVR